jgi:hypothetical protein
LPAPFTDAGSAPLQWVEIEPRHQVRKMREAA